MKQGDRRLRASFIGAGTLVLTAAVLVTLCRAQGGGASPQTLLPDLMVYSITAPSSASRGAAISVSDVTTNTSAYSAPQSVSDVYICTNVNNVTSSCWVTNHPVAGIAKGKSWPWAGSVTVPATQPLGTNYYIVVANGNRQVNESNYNNNTNYVMIVINP